MINKVESTPDLVSAVYKKSRKNISYYKEKIKNDNLTLSEKILIGHLFDMEKDDQNKNLERDILYIYSLFRENESDLFYKSRV